MQNVSEQIVAWRNEGITFREIGRRLGISTDAAKKQFYYQSVEKPEPFPCGVCGKLFVPVRGGVLCGRQCYSKAKRLRNGCNH